MKLFNQVSLSSTPKYAKRLDLQAGSMDARIHNGFSIVGGLILKIGRVLETNVAAR